MMATSLCASFSFSACWCCFDSSYATGASSISHIDCYKTATASPERIGPSNLSLRMHIRPDLIDDAAEIPLGHAQVLYLAHGSQIHRYLFPATCAEQRHGD
jgi:hypothetical protein